MAEYIEKQAVLDEIDEEIQEFPECEYALTFAKRWIRRIPTADVRPVRRGRWEMDSDNIPHCTECGCVAPQRLFLQVQSLACTTQFIMSNFCLDCGSDMREEEKNENA